MIKYPQVKHKLPDLFTEIIANDNSYRDNLYGTVTSLPRHLSLKKRKRELIDAGDKYVQRQKGGTGGATV